MKNCPFYIQPELSRRPGNALNVELGLPLARCKLKIPKHWENSGVSAARWLMSGGSSLVLGVCTNNCPNLNKK